MITIVVKNRQLLKVKTNKVKMKRMIVVMNSTVYLMEFSHKIWMKMKKMSKVNKVHQMIWMFLLVTGKPTLLILIKNKWN